MQGTHLGKKGNIPASVIDACSFRRTATVFSRQERHADLPSLPRSGGRKRRFPCFGATCPAGCNREFLLIR